MTGRIAISADKSGRTILHVITTLSRGGAENHLVELALAQARAGHRVIAAFLTGDGYWTERLTTGSVAVVNLHVGQYADALAVLRLRRLLRRTQVTLVHAHLPPAELYTCLALSGMGSTVRPPVVISKHNAEPFWPRCPAVGKWLGQAVARRSQVFIAASQAAATRAVCDGLVRRDRPIHVVPYGIDPTPYRDVTASQVRAARSQWLADVEPDGLLYGTVARLVPQKGLDCLLKAFRIVRGRSDRAVRLVIVGRGPLEVELKAQSQRLGVSDAVHWLGFREDVPLLMAAFDVFVLSSMWEGFGLVLLEAMAANTPIVASRIDGIPEVLGDGAAGLLVPPSDPEALAQAMVLLQRRDLRDRLVAGGRGRLEAFTIERMVSGTEAAYQQALTPG